MGIAARIVGAIIGGGGTYAAAAVFEPGLAPAIVFGAAGVMAVLGAVFGPKIWEVVVHVF